MPDGHTERIMPLAELAHSCVGRTRLIFAEFKGHGEALDALCERAKQLSSVVDAETRPMTGSMIFSHWGSTADLIEEARHAGLFSIDKPQERESVEKRACYLAADLEGWLKRAFGRDLDLRSLAALAFAAMAIRQISKGVIAPPAATAIWSAVILLLAEKGIEKITDGSGPAAD